MRRDTHRLGTSAALFQKLGSQTGLRGYGYCYRPYWRPGISLWLASQPGGP